jgi:protein-tyrosine phosphatase
MIARPYWITSQLAIVRRPQGDDLLDDEMSALKEAGMDVIVSMLQKDEARKAGLEREASSAQEKGLQFINFPVPDRGVPLDTSSFIEFLKDLESLLALGKRVGVHCRASIGRSSVTSASLLIRSGIPSQSAWLQISVARDCSVPDTTEQRDWVDRNMRSNS